MTAPRPALPTGLYGILDLDVVTTAFLDGAAHAFADAGVKIVQVRGPSRDDRTLLSALETVLPTLHAAGALVVTDNRCDLALAAGADGVHLAPDGLPPAAARSLLGASVLIGLTTRSPQDAEDASIPDDLDYVSFGPVLQSHSVPMTPLGLDALAEACRRARLPVVAIGGLDLDTCRSARAAGAAAVAMIGAVLRGDLPQNLSKAMLACA